MGSYLSIVNDTPDEWQCKVGPDEKAMKIFGYVFTALGLAVSPPRAVIGWGGKVASGMATLLSRAGTVRISAEAFSKISAAAKVALALDMAGLAAGYPLLAERLINQKVAKEGFRLIKPGQKERWGKMSLSLWQQGTCTRAVPVDATTVRVDTMFMRPIFSGATKNSNRDHKIQWWIDKSGIKSMKLVLDTPGAAPGQGPAKQPEPASSPAPGRPTGNEPTNANAAPKKKGPCGPHRDLQEDLGPQNAFIYGGYASRNESVYDTENSFTDETLR